MLVIEKTIFMNFYYSIIFNFVKNLNFKLLSNIRVYGFSIIQIHCKTLYKDSVITLLIVPIIQDFINNYKPTDVMHKVIEKFLCT